MSRLTRKVLNLVSSIIQASLDVLIYQLILSFMLSVFSESIAFEVRVFTSGIIAVCFVAGALYGFEALRRPFEAEEIALARTGILLVFLNVLFAVTSEYTVPLSSMILSLASFFAINFMIRYSLRRVLANKIPSFSPEPTAQDPKKIAYLAFKRAIDLVLSTAAIIILLPLFIVLAVMIKLQSPGPVIHKRKCISKDGYYFMYKFRSMVYDAYNLEKYLTPEQIDEYHRNIKLLHDPRITKLGRVLRKTSLDELPQLFNVLKGDMSLVGVRPLAEEEIYLYGDDLDEMLSVKPGITGYWQTHGRSNAAYDSGKRQELELYYVRHQSFVLDVKILLRTIVILLRGGGGAR